MAVTIEEYQKLKREVEEAERTAAKAEGALQQAMGQMKMEFDVDSIAEAEELLVRLHAKATEEEENFRKSLEQFRADWKERLDA